MSIGKYLRKKEVEYYTCAQQVWALTHFFLGFHFENDLLCHDWLESNDLLLTFYWEVQCTLAIATSLRC